MVFTLAGAFLCVLVLDGCNTGKKRDGEVARVENAVLTEADLTQAHDSSGEVRAFSREYVNEWVVRELLYQEAERRGLPESEEFQHRLHEAAKRMAVATLLQQELYDKIDTNAVTEEAIQSFFSSKGKEFTLQQDVLLASIAVFDDRDAANSFRSRVLRGTSWENALQQIQSDPRQKAHLLQVSHREHFTRMTLFPEELWKLARSLDREDVSFPLKTSRGTYVIRVHQTYRQGDLPPLVYARNEVRQRVLMDLRREKYDALVASLKTKRRVDVHLDRIDTSNANPTE
jgi:hypothetical protein